MNARAQYLLDQKLLQAVNAFGLGKDGRIVHSRELAEVTILEGGNVNARDGYNNTPLILAALVCKRAVVELLLAHGANPCLRNNKGFRASDMCEGVEELRKILRFAEREWEETERYQAGQKNIKPVPAPKP
ncbi:MAG: hypothetical protein A2018_06330 [Alphaproteobacteria bacterium GWF2_58_20]|nr:MAG: hypothetical protein A2018_06330 [Alphaproteobacteria bacterium GWF2_58_20]